MFTYALLEGLGAADRNDNGLIEVSELADYILEQVPKLSERLFKLRQVPQRNMWGDNFAIAKAVAVLPAGVDAPAATIPTKPTHVVIAPSEVFEQAGGRGVQVHKLDSRYLVTLVKTEQGWVLVAKDGKTLGFVTAAALARMQ